MKTLKLNFTVPEDVAEALKANVQKRKRSAFVSDAVRTRLKELEDEQLKESLIRGYKATDKEMSELDKEMETATFENLEDVL
jgi:metal-responsive CopG/Arc/MetJ family transcriptional regulator